MWRYDSGRTAASPHELPAELHPQWTRQYSARVQVWDDPLNHDLMPYDKVFEPVVMGRRMFIGFNDTDKVVALDIETGEELWTFYTSGPVRFPPVAFEGKIYVTSDDGYLYCLEAADGRLKWKFRGGPSERKVLGNGRVISAWPARGGPVARDGQVYFAASIWPFMGTFIYALDAETGKVSWVNDGTGAQFIKQPHSAPSFAGVAPQGALVATDEILLVPGGRSVPAAFNRRTGEFMYYHLNDGGKGNGGSLVVANESEYFVHTRLRGVRPYDLETGSPMRFTHREPVLAGSLVYASADLERGKFVQAVDTAIEVPVELEAVGAVESLWASPFLWELEVDGTGDLIKAGQRLYAAGANSLSAVELPREGKPPRLAWSQPVEGEVLRLLAAGGKLFAVTLDGRIMAFGREPREPKTIHPGNGTGQTADDSDAEPSTLNVQRSTLNAQRSTAEARGSKLEMERSPVDAAAKAKRIVQQTGADEGYVLWFGVDDGQLLEAVLLQSKHQVVAVDRDAHKVDQLRRKFDADGLYGSRVALHAGDPLSFKAPPYIANLVVVGESFAGQVQNRAVFQAMFESVRPYGGALWLTVTEGGQSAVASLICGADLERGRIQSSPDGLCVIREGALPGSDDWTHQYGDIGNTVKSDDARVKAPLGLLWFGGTSNTDVLPRHGHGPPEQVIGGRTFIQGMNSISARDVYTGRLLWKTEFENLGTFGIYYDASYTNAPLSTIYNQKHIPGANGRGCNFLATEREVYVVIKNECQIFDAATGQIRHIISLPPKPGYADPPDWGYVGIYEDILFAGHGFAHYPLKFSSLEQSDAATIEDYSASDGLAAFDRHTGKLLWRVDSRHSFLHNGIVAGNGRVYCLDKLPQSAVDKLKRRGASAPLDYRIVAFDVRNGRLLWEDQRDIFGTWLGYSKKHDVLLLAGASASDRLKDEVGVGMTGYRGADGEVLWQDLTRKYTGPCILHNELILTSANSYQASSGAFNLLDGSPHLVRNPLTGKLEPWRIARSYGCNSIVASENLLTFRSGAAGFYDLLSKSGTASLGGFRSGCTANLVVANGVLNAPDYTRTCSCAYQNQTSLALIHMPDMEMWTYSVFGLDAEEGDRIERVGINFGAPGDRSADDGTLWLEYPTVGGDSTGLGITVSGSETSYFRRHASQVNGSGLVWVAASGVRDCESIIVTPEILRPKITRPTSRRDDDDDDNGTTAKSVPSRSGSAASSAARRKAKRSDDPPSAAQPAHGHPAVPYTVRLHFVEPDDLPPGQRRFDVSIQGQSALENFDIAAAAGGTFQVVVKEFNGVLIEQDLNIAMTRAPGTQAGPVLCGVELIAEPPVAGK